MTWLPLERLNYEYYDFVVLNNIIVRFGCTSKEIYNYIFKIIFLKLLWVPIQKYSIITIIYFKYLNLINNQQYINQVYYKTLTNLFLYMYNRAIWKCNTKSSKIKILHIIHKYLAFFALSYDTTYFCL